MAKDPKPPPSPFGEPEKRNWPLTIALWVIIVLAIAGIGWMIYKSPRQGTLYCNYNATGSWQSFGRCVEK